MGGISSIIWTDVVQFLVMMAAVSAALWVLWSRLDGDTGLVWNDLTTLQADGTSKLTLCDWSLDLHRENTLFTAITGYLLLNLAAYGTDQDLAQRMLTCRNAVAGGRSALLAIAFNLPVVAMFMLIGLLLFVFYQNPTITGAFLPDGRMPAPRHAFLTFIMHEMPPGLAGLMLAGLFAIALTSLLSAINAMASSFITDCYRRGVRGREDAHYLTASRLAVVGAGAVVAGMALVCIFWHRQSGMNLLGFAFNAVVLTSSGLLGVFCCALFTRAGSWKSAIAALVAAFSITLALQPGIVEYWAPSGWKTLAWPWRMVMGTALSFAVCCLGRARPSAP
jgi:Na+/proline symporter